MPVVIKVIALACITLFSFTNLYASQEIILCGNFRILILSVSGAKVDTTWKWDARLAEGLPRSYRETYFEKTDDCKPVNNGKEILATSSSGGVALIRRADQKILFYAFVPNVHSAERLPGNRIVVAASIREGGNRLELYDIGKPERPLSSDSLYSGHGVVWNSGQQLLYALGYSELRAYRLENWKTAHPRIRKINSWSIPGKGGHDLQPVPGTDRLVFTDEVNVWQFDTRTGNFSKFAPLEGRTSIKSVSIHPQTGRILYVQSEESWWAHHIFLLNPGEKIPVPGINVYKARWNTGSKK